jgi:class 3 adenylate cyclase
LTVLFCDLVGSTPLSQQLDAEEWRDLIVQYQQAAAGAVACFGGHVAKNLGDGLLVYFGWPAAREDDPERAVRAGLAIVDAMAPLNATLAANAQPTPLTPSSGPSGPHIEGLAVRIGLHTGPVVIADGGEVFGETANVAARVQGAAEPDTVMMTSATQRLVAGMFVVEKVPLSTDSAQVGDARRRSRITRAPREGKAVSLLVEPYALIRPGSARNSGLSFADPDPETHATRRPVLPVAHAVDRRSRRFVSDRQIPFLGALARRHLLGSRAAPFVEHVAVAKVLVRKIGRDGVRHDPTVAASMRSIPVRRFARAVETVRTVRLAGAAGPLSMRRKAKCADGRGRGRGRIAVAAAQQSTRHGGSGAHRTQAQELPPAEMNGSFQGTLDLPRDRSI